jgi:PKD repeat protein
MRTMGDDVLREFGRYRRRHLWVRGWDLFLEAAFVMTVTAAAMLLVDRLVFEVGLADPHLSLPGRVLATLAGTLALAAVLAAGVLFLRPTPPAEIAWKLDRAAGGEERFLSALELAGGGGGGPFAGALCRDAVQVARRAEPSRVLPRAPVGYRWGILLSLAAGGALYAFPARPYDAPRADFDAFPRRGPAPLTVAFEDASLGAIQTFSWDFGDGQTARGESATHIYDRPGTYSARLRLRGPGGESSKTCEIEVLSPDRPAADFRARPVKGRAPLEVRFENLSQNARRFAWNFGDGAVASDAAPLHTYREPGLYDVRLRATNDVAEDEQVRARYVKVAHPDEPLADFRALPREGEAPLEVFFEHLATGAITEWEWDFGDARAGAQSLSSERNPTHVYRSPGRYTVRLRVKGPHGEDVEEKARYIVVKDQGQGPGGGGGGTSSGQSGRDRNPGGAGRRAGKLESEKTARPKVELDRQLVKPHKPGQDLVEKPVQVFSQNPTGTGQPQDQPLERVLPHYKRAAEDSIERERIPPALRDYLRRYYESLAPPK